MTDNSVQEARIQSNDLTNVATAAAALNTHLNSLTFNTTHNNITNTNIQVLTSEMIISWLPGRINFGLSMFNKIAIPEKISIVPS